jgi:hypothetical protein
MFSIGSLRSIRSGQSGSVHFDPTESVQTASGDQTLFGSTRDDSNPFALISTNSVYLALFDVCDVLETCCTPHRNFHKNLCSVSDVTGRSTWASDVATVRVRKLSRKTFQVRCARSLSICSAFQ